MNFILRYVGLVLGLWLADFLLDAVFIDSWQTLLLAGFVLLLINTLIKPILRFLTIPLNIITLGLFGFFLNVALFWFGQTLVSGFEITGTANILWAAVITIFIYNLISRD